MIKAVFFDVGNTLFFYNYEFLRDLLEGKFQIDVTREELEATHKTIKKSVGSLLNQGVSHENIFEDTYRYWLRSIDAEEEKIDSIIDAIKNHPFPHLFWSNIEYGTKDLLNWFRDRGFKLGIISNAEGQIKRLVEHVGLTSLFDTILDSREVGFQKPDERIFTRALTDLGVVANEAVHVGDLFEADVVGARSAGILPILVDADGRYPNVDCIKISNVAELKGLTIFK